jgi:hypothetical protein
MRTRSPALVAVAVAAALALTACTPAVSLPESEPDAVGIAKAVVPTGEDTVNFILAGYADGEYFHEASITVGPETAVADAQGRPIDPMALMSGTQVSVWVEACAESYPVQCVATAMRVEQV